jgi:hypothetical protein
MDRNSLAVAQKWTQRLTTSLPASTANYRQCTHILGLRENAMHIVVALRSTRRAHTLSFRSYCQSQLRTRGLRNSRRKKINPGPAAWR